MFQFAPMIVHNTVSNTWLRTKSNQKADDNEVIIHCPVVSKTAESLTHLRKLCGDSFWCTVHPIPSTDNGVS